MGKMVERRRAARWIGAAPRALLAGGILIGGPLAAGAADSDKLEEVVITAQKRSENIQDVPIAVTAFTAQALQDKGVVDIHGLANLTPNVNLDAGSPFSGSTSVLSASIRGIGQDDFAMNLDPGVGVYLDGVYLARTVGANQNLLDVDRVEILKGPQGTLFGRNTIGGAISIVTHTPGDQYHFTGQVTGGSYNREDISGSADMPVASNFLTSLTFSSQRRDGWQKQVPYVSAVPYVAEPDSAFGNAGTGPSGGARGGQNQQAFRAKALWKISDDFNVTFTADLTHEDQSATPYTVLQTVTSGPQAVFGAFYNLCLEGIPFAPTAQSVCGPRAGANGTTMPGLWNANANPSTYHPPYSMATASTGNIDTTYANGLNFDRLDSYGGSVTADWTYSDDISFKSITSYRALDWKVGLDTDGSVLDMLGLSFAEGQKQISQELQMIGKAFGGRLNYVNGLYFFHEDGYIHDWVTFADGLFQVDGPNQLRTDSYAAFTHLNYSLTDQIGLTAGARYSLDKKSFEGGQEDPNGFVYKIAGLPVAPFAAKILGFPNPNNLLQFYPPGWNYQSFYEFTPTVGAEYHWTGDLMNYFSYSKGFKTGGWTTRLTSPESTASAFGPEKANTYEVGAKSQWLDHRLLANLALFYTDYQDIQLNVQNGLSPTFVNAGSANIYGAELESQARLGGGLSLNTAFGYTDAQYSSVLPTAVSNGVQITTGFKLPKTPKWKASVSPQYLVDLANDATLRLSVDYTYTGTMYNDISDNPLLKREATSIVNSSVSYVPPNDRWELTLGGTNITNTRYITTGTINYAAGVVSGTYSDPAEWYVSLKIKL
jgi:iron complex outermembrane receptor protein